MLAHTRGIVLRNIRFSETSIISRIYTEQFGMRSYLIGGVRSEKSRMRAAYFLTLNLLSLHVYHRPQKALNRIREANLYYPMQQLHAQPLRSSMGLLMAEVFASAVREEEPNPALFAFLERQLIDLDQTPVLSPNLLLRFFIQFSAHLGFYPSGRYTEDTPVFNLQEGRFESSGNPRHPVLEPPFSLHLSSLLDMGDPQLTAAERSALLHALLQYYQLHLPEFRPPRSLDVLRAVFKLPTP
ncbi:MAG: DNA repair protein RecO [Chitinophagales bacterium]|nr:DNA repair protein RecO [Chitinophagales bacterium]MDW8394380.1 DNA repair protein RecO [Chitinophagales bacterium]